MASLTNRKKDSLSRTGILEQFASDRETQAQSTCFKFQLNDIDNVLDRIKGTEKFRWLVALPVILGYSIGLTYLIPFFIKIPNLLCTGFNEEDGEFMYSCSASQMCSAKDYNYYSLDTTSNFTFTNWITSLSLFCISDFKLRLFGLVNIAGYAFGALVLLKLGDIFGRKPVILVSSILSAFVYLLMYTATNINLIYALLFIDGALWITKGMLCYILVLELIPKDLRNQYGLYIIIGEGIMTALLISTTYYFKDCMITFPVLLFMSIIHIVFVYQYCPESPKFLLSVNKFDEMNRSFQIISEFNKSDFDEVEIIEYKELSSSSYQDDTLRFYDCLNDNIYRRNILIMGFAFKLFILLVQ